MTTPVYRTSNYCQSFERSARLACVVAPSRLLFAFLLLAVAQAQALLWWCRLPFYLFLPAALAVLIYAAFEARQLLSMRGRLITYERRWFWQIDGGEAREFRFRGELVLWRWLIVINGRDLEGRRLRLVLGRDSMGRDEWRRLQGALRFSR